MVVNFQFPEVKTRFDLFFGFYFSHGLKSKGTLQGFTRDKDIYADLTDVFKDKPTFTNYQYEPLRNYNIENPTVFSNIAVGYRLKFKN